MTTPFLRPQPAPDGSELLDYETEQPEQPYAPDPVKVDVCGPVVTKETVPQHISCYTVIVDATAASGPVYDQLLPLDPLRVRAVISVSNSGVTICHSLAQAQDPLNQQTAAAGSNGARLPANTTITLTGTQQMWVAGSGTQFSRVAVMVERRTP